MRGKTEKKVQTGNEGSETRKRPGRRPMTAEEKTAAAKLRAEEKERAENLKPEIILQFQENDVNIAELVEAAKTDFHKTKKRTRITEMKLYVKPEDRMAYYVINATEKGQIPL